MSRGELLLQLHGFQGVLLRTNLKLDRSDHAEEKAIEQHFHSEAIEVQHARPYRERGRLPPRVGETKTTQQQQMNNAERRPRQEMNRNCLRRKARSERQALA